MTSSPVARSVAKAMKSLTTGRATSASSRATRTSRIASATSFSDRAPRPVIRSKTPVSRSFRASNIHYLMPIFASGQDDLNPENGRLNTGGRNGSIRQRPLATITSAGGSRRARPVETGVVPVETQGSLAPEAAAYDGKGGRRQGNRRGGLHAFRGIVRRRIRVGLTVSLGAAQLRPHEGGAEQDRAADDHHAPRECVHVGVSFPQGNRRRRDLLPGT